MNYNERIYKDIYNKIFLNIEYGNVDVFLCGGANNNGKKTPYRQRVRKVLDDNEQISIWYPEELFAELQDRKKLDLLTLENYLAENSDVIIVVSESPGSYAELGAFVNNQDTCDKVIVLLKNKYKNDKGFIRRGLVEYIRTNDKQRVLYYNEQNDDILSKLQKYIIKNYYNKSVRVKKDLKLITGQYYYIILMLFFFKEIDYNEIAYIVRKLFNIRYEKSDKSFEIIFRSALKRLFKEGMATKDNNYYLTRNGYAFAKRLLSYVEVKHKARIINQIRLDVLNEKYYKGGDNLASLS